MKTPMVLIGQNFPMGTEVTDVELRRVAKKLNGLPLESD